MTRDDIRNTASTLAHYWVAGYSGTAGPRDHEGVRRIILSHHADMRPVLCSLVVRYIKHRAALSHVLSFERMLFELAGIDDEADERAALASLAELEQARS